MGKTNETPDYVFESSWEVCNKVGGIYTVLSTKARTLQTLYPDRIIFIGPDVREEMETPGFIEDNELFAGWREHVKTNEDIRLKVGRWDVPGTPPVVLVDFTSGLACRDDVYYQMWKDFNVNSMAAYGDYDESCMFACSAGKVIESFHTYYKLQEKKVVALFNEWTLGMGALYVKKHLPAIATLFTTHATSIGRSIAGNDKPLYSQLDRYNGDQMARELNVEAKHSVEKETAHRVDCFTTVSDITALECTKLLDKAPDIVTPNGFEQDFVPEGDAYAKKRKEARATLFKVAEKLTGDTLPPNALLIATSGRYEYRNKGIDVFIEAMDMLRRSDELSRDVVAFVMVPAWVKGARADLQMAVEHDVHTKAPLQAPFTTHWLNRMEQDKVLDFITRKGFTNESSEKVKILFVPCYLDGSDGIFNTSYYDLLPGMDVTVFPSYYEPWGYTPLESIAFGIPTITTDLAGFGLWARKDGIGNCIQDGVRVVNRTDYNYFDVAEEIKKAVLLLSKEKKAGLTAIREKCRTLALEAQWSNFISFYQSAFSIALRKAKQRK
jgi:glycosyltransferase involved in cell wall biosynthesis